MNNFVSDSIADPRLNEYFGFTQAQVDQLLQDTGLTAHASQLKECKVAYGVEQQVGDQGGKGLGFIISLLGIFRAALSGSRAPSRSMSSFTGETGHGFFPENLSGDGA